MNLTKLEPGYYQWDYKLPYGTYRGHVYSCGDYWVACTDNAAVSRVCHSSKLAALRELRKVLDSNTHSIP